MKKRSILLSLFIASAASNLYAEQSKIGSTLNKKVEISTSDLPSSALEAIYAIQPKFKVNEAEKEFKHGNVYLDIEGELPNGDEIEFDMLKKGDAWTVVEIQRDLVWAQLPTVVAKELKADTPSFTPKRIIESIQHGQNVTVYEFYSVAADGTELRKEVKVEGDSVEVLKKEWTH